TPHLALNSGGTASYTGGLGSTLTFTYTVASGQRSPDLDYNRTTALTLNNGNIKDTVSNNPNDAIPTLPTDGRGHSQADNKAIVINTSVKPPTITVKPSSLPDGTLSATYNQTISATGGSGSYTFSKLSGNLPPGLTLTSNGGLSGKPTTAGSFTFTVKA